MATGRPCAATVPDKKTWQQHSAVAAIRRKIHFIIVDTTIITTAEVSGYWGLQVNILTRSYTFFFRQI